MAFGELTSKQDSPLHAFDPKSALIAGVMGQFASTLIGHIRADTNQPSNPHALEVLDIGTCAVVDVLDEDRVIKIFPLPLHPNDTESLQLLTIEQRAYERLGHHPRICRYISKEKNGLVLERLEKNLGKYLCTLQEGGVDCTLAWVWSIQITESVAFAHSKGVLHADLGCHNVLLDSKNDAKLCDFAGSSIDGEDAKISYKARHQMYTEDENDGVNIHTEIFALGCTLYELWTTREPYADLDEKRVRDHYLQGCFPDVEGLPGGPVISKCWNGNFTTAQAVLDDLKKAHELWKSSCESV
jgi:serine/threonine protein kinase